MLAAMYCFAPHTNCHTMALRSRRLFLGLLRASNFFLRHRPQRRKMVWFHTHATSWYSVVHARRDNWKIKKRIINIIVATENLVKHQELFTK